MKGFRQDDASTRWGSTTVEDLGSRTITSASLGQTMEVRCSRFTWRPSPELGKDLPDQFAHDFDCLTDSKGVRRFTPSKALSSFIHEASLSGTAILSRQSSSEKLTNCHNANRLIFGMADHLQEHFSRRFKHKRNLYVAKAGRIGSDDAHILPTIPEEDGNECNDALKPWTPRDVVERGRQEAKEAGIQNADEEACIILGLTSAAKLNPIELSDITNAKSRQLVRVALFDLGPSLEKPTKRDLATVYDRLMDSLSSHLEDDTESFNSWFYENVDNIVHQIAKRKKPMDRTLVRQSLLELVFRSFVDIGHCVHTLMTAFCESLPQPLKLNHIERSLFGALYLAKPKLGGMPLILLRDRFQFLKPIILEIMEKPTDNQCLGVLLRLLHYYAFMASKKRGGDRNYKKQSTCRNGIGRVSQSASLIANVDSAAEPELDFFQKIVKQIREEDGTPSLCACGTTTHWRGKLVEDATTRETIVYDDVCGRCYFHKQITVSRKEFKEVGKKVQKEEQSFRAK